MEREPEADLVALIRGGYGAFNRRDIDGAVAAMTSDVEWSNGWEGGYVHGHDGVREYWTRQWLELDPTVTPLRFALGDDGRVVVDVAQDIRQADGTMVSAGTVHHLYTLRDGLVARMDIAEPES